MICTAIYDNITTWYETSTNSVNVYDLTEGKILDIRGCYGGVTDNIPVSGSKIVWPDMGDNITMYDISTNNITQITTSGYNPDIYGNNIVYVKSISDTHYPYTSYYSVYWYDITSSKETQLTEYSSSWYTPVIHGNKIAWSKTEPNSKTSIYMYNLSTYQINTISTNVTSGNLLNSHKKLDIYGNIVVWSDVQNGKSDIYMQNLSTHETTQVTISGIASNPAIYDKYIVYDSLYRLSDEYVTDIYMYDISTGETTQITSCGCAWSPSIYKNKIVYVDSHAAGTYNFETGDIYLYDLSPEAEKPAATFTANLTSGIVPLKVQFTSETTGNPTDYYWVFEPSTNSDWNSHHAVTAVHTFTQPGVYTVALTVSNDAGSYTATREGYITVTDASGSTGNIPTANFSAIVSSGTVPSVVLFTDTSTGFAPTSCSGDSVP